MPDARPFRFGVMAFTADSRRAWEEKARRIEASGYDVLIVADHLTNELPAVPSLIAAAYATSTIRIGCTVFANDFKHPVVLAQEAAMIDMLSEGRFEFGIGAGWLKDEYERAGIPFDPPGVRIARMVEGLHVIKGLWGAESFTYNGAHYTITELDGTPKPVQRPHPPIFIGGTGKKMLEVAGREADIAGLLPKTLPYGGHDWASSTEDSLAERIGWVRDAAGSRFARIELGLIAFRAVVTDDQLAKASEFEAKYRLTAEQLLASPDFLIGSVDQIEERLLDLRERFGTTYFTVSETDFAGFAPVVARLAGR